MITSETPQGDQEDRWSKLQAENAKFRNALEFYADPKNWWNQNVGDPLKYHNADLDGSIERMNAKVGTIEKGGGRFVHDQFFNDGGDRARRALGRKRRSHG